MAAPLSDTFVPPATAVGVEPSRRWGWARQLELIIPAGVLVVLTGACFLWPMVYSVPRPVGGSILDSGLGMFSPGHILGTDQSGNDIMSRILYGGRVSLRVGLFTQLIGLGVGGLIGVLAAYWGGIVDSVVMRVVDTLIAFPALVLALAIAEALGPSEMHVVWALCAFTVPAFARIARAATLRLREEPFMLAARLSGTRGPRLIARHIVPNILPQLVTFGLLGMGVIIMLEGALSFVGLSVRPPGPSWGNMIAQGQATLTVTPELVLIPSAFLLVTVMSLNLLGDALRVRWGVK
jgi:peptide/nickel transport system permease protein